MLGSSERTGIEVFAVGDHALGIQGHPEFTEDVVTDLIDSRLKIGVLTVSIIPPAIRPNVNRAPTEAFCSPSVLHSWYRAFPNL